MEFSSLEFLFRFLPIFLIIYYLVPVKYKNPVLFFGSLVFYAMGSWKDALLLLFSMSLNYILVLLMDHIRRKSSRNTMLVILLCYNIGLLCIFKYTRLSLPLGISFYTFTMLSYVLDVYKKKTAALRDYLEYGTYILLFPKLISGPIAQFADMAEQLKKHPIRLEKIEHGLTLFIIGLGYKVIIANHLAILWRDIQGIGFESISTPLAWMGAFGYSAQLFFDFQGYSLMAIGVAAMMGIALPVNFLTPYASLSVSEFYRRWHVTLGAWFRDYVYIPLGGNRKGMWKTIRNLAVVWALTGLWHGMHWNFLLWAGILFLCICLERLGLRKWLEKWPWLGHLYVWLVIPLSWMPFAIHNKDEILAYFGSLFGVVGAAMRVDDIWVAGGKYLPYFFLAFVLAVTTTRRRSQAVTWEDKKPWIEETTVNHAGSLWQVLALGLIFWWAVYKLSIGSVNPFMYFSF